MQRNLLISFGATLAIGLWAVPAGAQTASPGQPNDPARGSTRVTPGAASTTDGSDTPIGGALGGTLGGSTGGGGPKQSKVIPGAAAAGPGGGPVSNVGVQQQSRLGVGGAAGEAGECCKPKEFNAAAVAGSSVNVQQGARSASAGGAAGDAGECCKPKEINAASLADGSVRSAPPPAQNARRQPDRHP